MYRSPLASSWPLSSPLRLVIVLTLTVVLGACSMGRVPRSYVPGFVSPYRPDIQQGNWITQQQASQLQAGMTRDQVRFLLGSPLLTDIFHADRWDYLFLHQRGKARKPVAADDFLNPDRPWHFTLYFENDRLVRWEGDTLPSGQPFSPTAVPGTRTAPSVDASSSNPTPPQPDIAAPTGSVPAAVDSISTNLTPEASSPTSVEPTSNGLMIPSAQSSSQPEPSSADEPIDNGTSVNPTPSLQAVPSANQPLGSRSASGLKMPVLP